MAPIETLDQLPRGYRGIMPFYLAALPGYQQAAHTLLVALLQVQTAPAGRRYGIYERGMSGPFIMTRSSEDHMLLCAEAEWRDLARLNYGIKPYDNH